MRWDRRRGGSGDADPVGDFVFAWLGERRGRNIGRGCGGSASGTLGRGAAAEDTADRGHADGLVDDPRQAPGPVLVAWNEPDGDRNEANCDERDDDDLGQNQTSHAGRGEEPDLRGDASTASCPSKPNQTTPDRTAPARPAGPEGPISEARNPARGIGTDVPDAVLGPNPEPIVVAQREGPQDRCRRRRGERDDRPPAAVSPLLEFVK